MVHLAMNLSTPNSYFHPIPTVLDDSRFLQLANGFPAPKIPPRVALKAFA
jgi:hypothetical protein